MRRTLLLAVGLTLTVAISGRRVQAAGSSCRATDAGAIRLRSYIRELVTTTAADRVQLRNKLGLAAMDSTRVVLITDDAVCDKLAQGINASVRTTGLVRQLYAVTVGSNFAAQDPGHPAGEWWPTSTLDKKYKFIAVVMAP
jgi:hypothetical protein